MNTTKAQILTFNIILQTNKQLLEKHTNSRVGQKKKKKNQDKLRIFRGVRKQEVLKKKKKQQQQTDR